MMKKNKLNYLTIITLLFAFIFSSCSSEENIEEIGTLEPELFTDFNIVDGSSSYSTKAKADPGVKVTLSIGRKSKNCGGIGICKIKEITITLFQVPSLPVDPIGPTPSLTPALGLKNSTESEENVFNVEEINGLNYLTLALTSTLDPIKFDTNFYVDEDVIDEESEITIPKGTYTLDNSIGNYGGYKVLLNN